MPEKVGMPIVSHLPSYCYEKLRRSSILPPRFFLPKRSKNYHTNLALKTEDFIIGGTASILLLKPRHNTLYYSAITDQSNNGSMQFSENLLSLLYPCLKSVD